MRHDVYAALASVTTAVLTGTESGLPADVRLDSWAQANAERVERARSTLSEALARDRVDLATLSVVLRVMRGLPG
jgi:glutamate dehydrogenase